MNNEQSTSQEKETPTLKNDLLLRAARGEAVERPPVWLMRQAGRILPQYRELRASLSGFKELVETPELACEVTIQPIDELGVDAAIIFSDILVVPEVMGLRYEMIPGKGPMFPMTIQLEEDVDKLIAGEKAAVQLDYVYKAIRLTKAALNGRVPLIGFAGAPWTIMAYMLEGSGSKTFSKARRFLYKKPISSHVLLQKITETTIDYLRGQIKAGADLVQIFDSWAGILTPEQYKTYALPYIRQICDAITEVPVTVFAKNAWFALPEIGQLNCNVVGIDWNTTPQEARRLVGESKTLQGNLDPCLLYAPEDTICATTHQMVRDFGDKYICNLGHGVYPDTPLDNVKIFVDAVKSFTFE